MVTEKTLSKKGSRGTCSATAIAPHVLLTAAHCVDEPFDAFLIDHVPATIVDVVVDSNDHALVRVTATFEHYAPLGPPSEQGHDIFFWGNPGGIEDVMRKGYVSKDNAIGVEFIMPVTIYSMPVNQGDSGSGVFNLNGEVQAVVSKKYVDGDFVLMGSFDFAFTNDDIKAIGLVDDVKGGIKVRYDYLVAPLAI